MRVVLRKRQAFGPTLGRDTQRDPLSPDLGYVTQDQVLMNTRTCDHNSLQVLLEYPL